MDLFSQISQVANPQTLWKVNFRWPLSAEKDSTWLTYREAKSIAKLFGTKMLVNVNEKTITLT